MRCVVLTFGIGDGSRQYPIGFVVSSGCFCRGKKLSIWISQLSVSSVAWPVLLESVRIGGDFNVVVRESMDFSSSSLSGPKVAGRYFHSLPFSGTARRAKLGINPQNTLHNPK